MVQQLSIEVQSAMPLDFSALFVCGLLSASRANHLCTARCRARIMLFPRHKYEIACEQTPALGRSA
jgi:hypothetical protein